MKTQAASKSTSCKGQLSVLWTFLCKVFRRLCCIKRRNKHRKDEDKENDETVWVLEHEERVCKHTVKPTVKVAEDELDQEEKCLLDMTEVCAAPLRQSFRSLAKTKSPVAPRRFLSRPSVELEALCQTAGPDEWFLLSKVDFLTRAQMAALKVTRKLGEGAFGSVNLVKYRGCEVVMKVLKETDNKAMFMWEARVLQELNGTGGAPRLLAVCADHPAFLQENAGMCYDRYLAMCTVDELIHSLVRIAKCLHCIHEKGFVHTDIKFDNVTVSGSRANPRFHIIDFGLASRIGLQMDYEFFGLDRDLFMENDISYISPELKEGKPLHSASDVYSLGMMIAWIMEGAQNPEVTRCLAPIRDACTRRDPEQRPSLYTLGVGLCRLRDRLSQEQLATRIRHTFSQ